MNGEKIESSFIEKEKKMRNKQQLLQHHISIFAHHLGGIFHFHKTSKTSYSSLHHEWHSKETLFFLVFFSYFIYLFNVATLILTVYNRSML